jgi:putative chitinase
MYGGRMGNDDMGDGYLYRGRGFTQLTGEENYRQAGAALALDLLGNPDLAASRDNASRVALWYWQNRVPSDDRDDVTAAALAINGGDIGLSDRHNRFEAWRALLTPEFIADLDAGRVQPGNGVAPATGQDAIADGALRRFETGLEVSQLQTDLRALGVRDAENHEIAVDHAYGASTEQAVRRFQGAHELPVTGRAGAETLTAVQDALLQQQPFRPPEHSMESRPHDHGEDRRPWDPRHPNHPDHAMNQGLRDQVRSLHAGHGIVLADQQLDCITARVMADARRSGMMQVTALEFSEDHATGRPDLNGNLIAWQGDPGNPATKYSATEMRLVAIMQPDESYRQLQHVAQQQARLQAQCVASQERIGVNSQGGFPRSLA